MKNIYLALIIAIIGGITLTGGDCDDSTGTGGGTQNDPNVLVFNNLVLSENDGDSSSSSAINLLLGRIESLNSGSKDITLVDLNGNGQDFYFRSGDDSDNPNVIQGDETDFGQFIEWENLTQAQWDTLSRVWKSSGNADTISSFDFVNSDTRYPGSEYFGLPLTNKRVFAFYLKGKYEDGITSNPVFGMIYLDSAWNAGGLFPYRLQVDVKINTAGRNQFLQEVPIQ
ncbi:MAG TPA: hypothetical protein VK004_07215 [Ignavibacteria bacterium]|nr:hypothetical protein [Ignavibacteria bacterium]